MKRFYLFVLILLSASITNAQTLGVKINPEADMIQGMANQPQFGISCGMFYNQKIYKPLGFSAGIEYEQVRFIGPSYLGKDFFGGDDWTDTKQRTHLLQLPVDITLLMSENPKARCLSFFTVGYAVGDILEQQNIFTKEQNLPIRNILISPSRNSMINSFRMGMEFRYNPKPRLNLSFGVQYKYIWTRESIDFYSSNFNVLGAYVKTGLNFLHKKT